MSTEQMMAEGWLLVTQYRVDGSTYTWIERYDEDPEARFASDAEALGWVIRQAKFDKTPLHINALKECGIKLEV